MAIHIEIHDDDEKELTRIRTQLLGLRNVAGISQQQLSVLAGRSHKWLNELEQAVGHPHLSSLQQWAGVFDLRLEPKFSDLIEWSPNGIPNQVLLNWQMSYRGSRPFRAYDWQRVHLISELVAYRHAAQVSATELSGRLGLSVSAVSGWERDGNDPLVSKVFTYVRALGGSVTFALVGIADWKHE